MTRPTKVQSGWIAVHPAGHPEAGQEVTREATCPRCGRVHRQSFLAPDFIDAIPERYREQFARDVPGGWVPVYCGPCERRDLARHDVPSSPREPWLMRDRQPAA